MGKKISLIEACECIGIKYASARYRLKKGYKFDTTMRGIS